MRDKNLERECRGFVSVGNCEKTCPNYNNCDSYHLAKAVNEEYGTPTKKEIISDLQASLSNHLGPHEIKKFLQEVEESL
jgi:hypothetical protein